MFVQSNTSKVLCCGGGEQILNIQHANHNTHFHLLWIFFFYVLMETPCPLLTYFSHVFNRRLYESAGTAVQHSYRFRKTLIFCGMLFSRFVCVDSCINTIININIIFPQQFLISWAMNFQVLIQSEQLIFLPWKTKSYIAGETLYFKISRKSSNVFVYQG